MKASRAALLTLTAILVATGLTNQTRAQTDKEFDVRRKQLVELVREWVKDERVLKSVANTERHRFVPESQREYAYLDLVLPLGHKVTISPPYIVAYMTEQLKPKPTDRVLEIGTGSGYQAAILSPLVKDVYTIEIVEPIGKQAKERLAKLKYNNVHVKIGDGFKGWPEHAPFDKIIVTCSPENIPQPLVDQLKDGGRMVIPLGSRFNQSLCLVTKQNGKLTKKILESTYFVPMTGKAESIRVAKPKGRPEIRNGSFEEKMDADTAPHWYYLRQHEILKHPSMDTDNRSYIHFSNQTPGRLAQALQAFSVDGLKYRELSVSARVRLKDVKRNGTNKFLPALRLYFFDEDWKIVGVMGLGPFHGSFDWETHKIKYRVPLNAKSAVLGIGMWGAVGEASFDSIRVTAQ